MPNVLENLHRNLTADGYQLGSLDDFKKAMADSTKAANLYNNLSADGYQLGSQEDFFNNVRQMPQGFGQLDTRQAQQMMMGKGPISWEQPETPDHQETVAEKQRRMLSGNATQQEERQVQKRVGQRMDAIAYEQEMGKRLRRPVKDIEFEAPTVERDYVGNIRHDDNGNIITGFTTDQNAVSSHQQIGQEQAEWDAINEANREKSVEEQLQIAFAERDRLNQEMGKQQSQWVDADGRVHYGNRGNDEAMQALQAAYRQNEDRIKTLTYEKDNAGFWQHMGTELGDLSGWNPYSAVEDAGALLRASQKINSGQPLSDSDRLLLANTLLSQEAHSKYDQNRGAWFRAGGIGAESIKLMPDFIIGMGPMKGIATGIAKGTGKAITKAIGKKAAETVAGKILTKAAGVGLGTLTAGGALVNTVQLPRLASETMGNMTGDLTLDENGNYKFEGGDNFLNSVLKAEQTLIPEAASEVAGEFLPGVGTALEKIGLKKIASGLNRLQGTNWYKNYSRALEHTGFHGAPGEAVEEYLGDVYSAVLGDLSGIAGDPNSQKTDNVYFGHAGGWGDLDKHVDILLGTATLGALLHTPSLANTGRHGAQYFYYRHSANKADKAARDMMGDEVWNTLKASIDNTTNETISDVVNGMTKDPNLSTEQKKAIIDYGVAIQRQRGHMMAIMAENKEEKDEPGKAADVLDNSYAAGYEADTPEEKQAINQNLATATQNLDALGEGFAKWVKDESNPPMATLSYMMAHRDVYTDYQIAAAADYYQSKFASDGMKQAEADKAELDGEQSVKPLYTTVDKVNDEYTVSSFDKDGNLLEQQAFDTEDEAQAYQGEVKMQKQHQDLMDLYKSPRMDSNALAEFERQNGWQEGTVESIINSDPMQLTDTEWQIADQAMAFMQEMVYPATEVHTDFNREVGTEAADNAQIDTDMPNEQVVQSIVAPYIEARDKLNALFKKNEDIAEEVQMYENMGKSDQEIISLISNFNRNDVQTVIDFYNAQARFEGFMNRSEAKIEERVKMERQRHTFKGTIDGVADLNNVHTISDGTNRYYLVSGNVTTDPATGRITGSTSGLIIGMDLDGSFVQLSEDDGYSVDPVAQSLDQFEEAERTRLQQQVTKVIDPNGTMTQQPTEQQSGNVGGEAGAENSTGANEPPTPEPVNPPQPVNPQSPSGGEAQPQQPAVTIESVTDKDGIKRYENGIPVDDAIADIQNDGFDVNEIADASIAEAQQAIDKINAKQTKTRKDLVDKKKAQDVITYYNNVKARWAEMNQPAESEENVNVEPEKPIVPEKPVSSQQNLTVEEQKQQRIAEAKAKYGELFDDDFTKANDVFELVSMWVGRNRNLAWDDVNGKRGLQKELGWTRKIGGDTKYIETLLAKKGEGMGVDEFAHTVWQSDENQGADGNPRFSTEEIKEALLDMIKSARSKSDVVDFALNNRIILAEQALQEQRQREQEEAEQQEEVVEPTDEEVARMEASLPFAKPVEGEDIPDSLITQLEKAIAELQKQEGMPPIKLVDTDRMSEKEWNNLAALYYGGEAFFGQEEIDRVRDHVLSEGVFFNPETSVITVLSDSQTPEDVNNKIQTILDYASTIQEKGRNNRNETDDVEGINDATPQGEGGETPAAEGANEPESQGSTGSVEDPYLQPRNAEEEQIVANVLAQLQQEIGDAVNERNKARSELQKAQARESERATDLFGNDNALNQEGQLFDNSDMPIDNSAEGVDRRTAAEREKLQEATNKLNRLQSIEERNSRIRGALDNYRRQTVIETDEQPQTQSREEYLASHPLTEEQIMADTEANEDEKLNAIDFLNGEDSVISRFYYDQIYERAQKKAVDKINEIAQRGKKPETVKTYGNVFSVTTNKNGSLNVKDRNVIPEGRATQEDYDWLYAEFDKLGGKWTQGKGWDFPKENAEALDNLLNQFVERIDNKPTVDPIEAIEQAAQQFNQEQEEKKQQGRHRDPKTGEWVYESEQKSQDQQDIDDALKEFNDFLDNAKGSNVLDKFIRKGLEGNDKAQASLLDAFTLTNDAQRMFLKDLLRLASKLGYAYIKSGVHDVQAWSKKMSDSIGAKLREVLGWDDAIIGEFVDEVWNQKYTVDGQRMRLSEHAERLNNTKPADQTVNVNKNEDNEPEKDLSLQQEASEEKPKTKDGWLKKMNEVFKELCKKYGVPDDPIILNQWGGRYGFDYRITKGYRLDQFEPYYESYKKKLDEPVEPASDKQLAFIDRLAEEGEKEMLHSIKLNKVSASYVISILKAAEDAVTSRYGTASMFEEYANELEKVAKLNGWEPKLQGDSAEFADKQEKEKALRDDLKQELLHGVSGDRTLKTMQDVKKLAEKHGLDMSLTDLQEIVEAVIVDMARTYANSSFLTDKQKFDNIVALYQTQPTLSARDNDRINKQQYSTPAPMAFLMGQFLSNGKKVESGLEPSAGNGMLTINLPKEKMHVNDIDEMRLSNLQKQGFGEVTSQDGLQSFGEKKFDVVVTNPPFGNVTQKVYDGIYEISGLEHQMAINALESMKDDGRAAIIIGGNTEYNQNGSIKGKDRAFLNYLYAHYNVVDVINMNGHELYSRQGTGFPVRMILINGRKEFNPRSFAPTIQKARAERVNSYDELFKRVNDDILSDSNKPASVHDTESGKSDGKHDNGDAGNATQTGVRNVRTGGSSKQHHVLAPNGSSVQRGNNSADERTDTKGHKELGGGLFDVGSGSETPQHEGGETSQTELGGRGGRLASGGVDSERHTGGVDLSDGVGQRGAGTTQPVQQPEQKRGLSTEKVPYKKQSSNPFTLDSLMPAEQADEVKKILEELGDVDQFLVDELGYANKEELHKALAAEQIDSVAMAIHQMNQGNAFIIGDMTGIGKGRQAAALIRYGVKKGGNPVFITVKKGLFSDMYRDLCDIGSPKLRPFIWCAKDKDNSQNVTDEDGEVVYKWSEKEQKRVADYIIKNGKLPPEYDYIVTTYDGFKSGTLDYENGQKKPRNFGKGKTAGSTAINGQKKRDALEVLARNSYVIMDESHNAGGDKSNISKFLQYITVLTKGTTFLSATFAKRPENMPIYALRTAISKAGVKVDELIGAVKKGGATFQEVMSKALTGAGQMIRRERNMEGVTIDWKGIDDEAVVQRQRDQYDTVIGLFNDIIQFQRSYVDPIVNGMNDAAAEEQGEVDHTPGTRDMGINNTPFASRTYNMVQQVLLSLKAEEAGKRAVEHLKAGRKPVIAVANTNEGAADEAVGVSEEDLEMPDLSVNLKKGLQGTMRITKKDAFGNETNEMISFDKLSEEGQKRYAEIMDAIENASSGLSLSPIDVIKNELKKAGYKVGELTGRKAEFIYNEDGTVKRVKRQDTDKKRTAADFNSGKIDALVINRSAGTGISLHASSKFKDQRQRIMIVAQAQGDVNDEVQMRGRIDRTGQVLRGMYEYVVSQIPSEQRLLMMLKAKLRSLDANTTSSQKSKFNEMQVQDIINKYGDDIVIQYLAEHPDYAVKMIDPLKWGEGFETLPAETLIANANKEGEEGKTASKVLGRMALLKVKEQEKMLSEIGDLYQAEIDRLNEMGENDLEITEMPLRAKTVKKNVWEEGVEPGGKNPFADNSYIEEVEMDVLKKPMKGSEVKASQERLLGGKTWEEYKKATLEKADRWAEQKKAETTKTFTERAEKKAKAEQEKYVKGAKKAQEKNGMTDAEIEKNGKYQYDHFYKEEMDKLKTALEAIDNQKQVFVDALETFSTDGVYALPTDIYDLGGITFEPSFGKVIDINIKEDNYSTNASTITFATLDGRRKITIPINGMVKQNNGEKRDIKPIIVQQTAQTRSGFFGSNIANMLKVLEQNPDNWDKLTSTATRKKGHIITGNLLKALTSLRSQGKGGKLISYTTDTGEIRQGILMSDQFDPGALTKKNPISTTKDQIRNGDKVTSADGDVVIDRGYYGRYELRVPKSNKKGGKYFNDKTLLSLMNGQFEGSSQMKASFGDDNLDAVLKRLDELGVTVESSNEDSPKRMITTNDPMEAISQAAESWRQENMPKEIRKFINDLPKRFNLKGAAPTRIINSREELEDLKGNVSESVYREIEELYNEPDTGAAYIPRAGIVVVFGEKIGSVKEAESTWWHEQSHGYWQSLPDSQRRKFGEACLEYLFRHHRADYNHIINDYPKEDHLNEACSFFIGQLVYEHGTEKILASKFEGIEEICNFADGLINHIRNGREKEESTERDSLRYGRPNSSVNGNAQVEGSDQQGRERGDNVIRPEEESSLQEEVDPIEAIELSAKRWKKQRKDRESDINDMKDYSAKGVYEQRINSVAYVTTESYQDAMAGLKVSQNAIAKDKDIPDSQNAYMAENLMHGKNGTEQQVFDATIRDRILDTVKRMMAIAGMRMGDIDRYCFAKHGLERNRELFVRDWLKSERRKSIKSYEDLNQDEQEIFHDLEEKLHEQFDDGIIETEEELNKKLEKALQQAHDEYIDSVEDGYVKLKERRFADLKDRKITLSQYLDEIDKYIQQNIDGEYVASEHDYSGFRSMYGDENGEYNEGEIIAEVMTDEGIFGNDLTDEFWAGVNEASRYGLERYREAGMRSDEQIDKVEQMFHFYVPMRGFKEDRGEDMYQYFTGNSKEVSHLGGLLKHAKGRKSEASYPLATLFALTYKAISDCNQNLVNQKFYRLCQANPNDLVVLSDSWAELDENTGEWEEVYPPIPEDAGEEEIRQAMMAFEEEMRQKELEGKAKKLKGKPKFDYRPADKKKRDEHIVEVYMNGQKRLMTIVGNPRAAQALNGFTRFHIGDNWLSHANAAAKNWMSKVSTSYNPTFAARNMFRDWTHFEMILITREGSGYAKAAQGYYHPMRMKALFDKFKAGTLDMNNEEERDFKDFMDNGGITGYVRMNKVKDMQDDVESIIKKAQQTGVIKNANKLWDSVLGAVEAWNEAIENSARFATFRASRHYAGRTKARSAYDAKEVTVNFNRKGAGSNTAGFKSTDKKVERAAKLSGYSAQLLGEGRMFFNATLQAVATIFKNFKNPDGSWNTKYIKRFAGAYASVPFVGGMLIPAINMALMNLFGGDDDDPYANLPEWVRRKNICIWLGWIPGMEEKLAGTEHSGFFKDSFLTIPVGQEIAAFYSLGDLAASLTFYPELKPVDLSLEKEFWGFLNVFSPIDLDTKVTNGGLYSSDFVPEALGRVSTVLAPAIAVQQNLSWTGRKIYREDKYKGDETIPEYQMVYNNTNSGYIWVSKGLNYLGGGDDIERGGKILGIIPSQVNPGAMQYLVEQYSGGPGKFASNTSSAVRDFYEMALGDKGEANFNVRKVEILKAFIQQADDNTKFYRAKAKYRRYKEEAEERSAQLSRAQKDAKENPEHYMKAEELSKGVEAARMYFIKENDKTLKAINKEIYSSTGQKRKDFQALYNQKLSEMVDSLDNMKPVEEMYRRERK